MKNLLLLLSLFTLFSISAKNKEWTCINEKGEQVFTIQAIRVYDFKSGLARVYKNTLVNNQWVTGYGYINQKGEVVIDCNLDKAQDFQGNIAWVKFEGDDHFSMINKSGEVITNKKYEKVGVYTDRQTDIFAVYEDGRMGFVNDLGEEIVPCKYTGTSIFQEGLVCVADYDDEVGYYGFIDKTGKEVIPLKFKQSGVSSFNNGLARASVGGKTVLINKEGDVVFKTSKGNIQGYGFDKVLVFTKSNRSGWGWLNMNDEFVIQPEYDDADNFNQDGYSVVEKDGLVGLMDTTGKLVLPLKYESIYCDVTEDGFILAVLPSKEPTSLLNADKEYYNASFEKIDLAGVKHIYPANSQGLMQFTGENGKQGFLNKDFEVVIPAQYDKADAFSEGLTWVR